MSHSGLLAPSVGTHGRGVRARLIVTRRDAGTGRYHALGFLDKLDDGYEFAYLAAAVGSETFVPLVGFSDAARRYRRPHLFPSFAERVIGAKRPDRPQYLASLNLDDDAGAWEILSASGGNRKGDAIELISLPTWDATTRQTSASFLAHGVRHRGPLVSEHVSTLDAGHQLGLERQPDNDVNPRAIKIVDAGMHLAYVPDPLVDYVGAVLDGTPDATVIVVQSNPPDTNSHLRLLLRLEGSLEEGFPFDGPDWRTTA